MPKGWFEEPTQDQAPSKSLARWKAIVACGLIAVLSGVAKAQQVYGSIVGNVYDSTGAVVVHATVKITDVAKSITFITKTNESGFYSQGQLIPDDYTVAIEAPGFKKVLSATLPVRVDNVSRFNATLALGPSDQTIEVSGTAPILQTDRSDIATTLTPREIQNLPTYQNSSLSFAYLTPGVMVNSSSTPTSENPQGSARNRVNGRVFGATGYQLDGTDNQDAWLGAAIINPTPDSLAESKFSTENFDAENGYVAGGLFVFSTKSGSNSLHGSLYEYLINNSRGFQTFGSNPFTQRSGAPPFNSNQFGGSVGGPILKNKLFYFGDIQARRQVESETLLTTVPTLLARQTCVEGGASCDLSDYLASGSSQIYDPTTGDPKTGQNRTPFAANKIPVSRLNQQALNLLKYFPLPNSAGAVPYENNYIARGVSVFNMEQYNTREDYRVNDKNSLFGRYTLANFSYSVPGAFGYIAGGPGLDGTGFSGTSTTRNQSLSIGYTRVFNANVVNEARFGYYQYSVHVLPGGYGTEPAQDAGIPGLNSDKTYTSGMPAFQFTGIGGSALGYSLTVSRCNCPLTEREQEFQVLDNFTKVAGNHTLKFGFDLRHTSNLRAPSDQHRSGELTFTPGYTGIGNANGGSSNGLGLATFLLGESTSFKRYVATANDATAYLERAHFFAQDTWHASGRLTLGYGLRWELTFPEATDPGKGSLLDLNSGNAVVFGVGGNSSRGFQQMKYDNFAPRVGLSFALTQKTIVRAGYGWAYDTGDGGIIFNEANLLLPVLIAQTLTAPNASVGVFSLASGPPTVTPLAPNSQGLIPVPNNVTEDTRPVDLTLSTTYMYNAAIQREINDHISVTAAYVGNSGRHVPYDASNTLDLNQAPFVPGATNLNSIKPFYGKFGWTQPVPDFCNCAVGQYNSLQVSVDVRNYHGYAVQGNYLYQRAYGDVGSSYTMLYNRPLGYGNDTQIPNQQIIIAQIYDLPFGTGRLLGSHANRLANAAIGGWTVSGITSYRSGQPFTVTIGSYPKNYAAPSVGPAYPDRGNASPYTGATHNRTQWYKGGFGTAFLLPAPNTFGNYGFDNLYGPIYINQDISLQKILANLADHYSFKLRADAFNAFNHTQLGNPNTNLTAPTAGQITSTGVGSNMRRVQFSLRMEF